MTLTATASDQDGTISRVDFFQNGALIGAATTAPYTFTWTSVPPGSYQLTAAATDDQGASATSAPVQVVVSSPDPLSGPTNLVATLAGANVRLTWSPPAGGPGGYTYDIYCSTASGFVPSVNNLVGEAASPLFLDRSRPAGTYYYRVVAFDASGTPTAASNQAAVTTVGSLAVDKIVFSDGTGARTTPPFSTASAAVLIAFAVSAGAQPLTVSGAGLSWTLVRRANAQAGTSEIWRASAYGALSNVTVNAQSGGSYEQSLTVVAFTGATGSGASAVAAGSTGAPAVTLTTTAPGSMVYAVGNDWDGAVARTLPSTQTLVHQYLASVGDTMWVQSRVGSIPGAGTAVLMNATGPTNHRWNLAAVEILAVSPGAGTVPVPDVVYQTQAAATG